MIKIEEQLLSYEVRIGKIALGTGCFAGLNFNVKQMEFTHVEKIFWNRWNSGAS